MRHVLIQVMSPNQYQRRHSAMLWVTLITNRHLRHLLSEVWCEDGLDAQSDLFVWVYKKIFLKSPAKYYINI